MPGSSGTNISLVDALSSRLIEAQREFEDSAECLCSLTLALTTTGDTQSTSKSFSNGKKKKSTSTSSQDPIYKGEVAEVATISKLFSDFETNFLSEVCIPLLCN